MFTTGANSGFMAAIFLFSTAHTEATLLRCTGVSGCDGYTGVPTLSCSKIYRQIVWLLMPPSEIQLLCAVLRENMSDRLLCFDCQTTRAAHTKRVSSGIRWIA